MKPLPTRHYSPFLYLSVQRIKFLCAVADEYEFISPAPSIYYDPITYQPTFLIDRLHQEYRADFLIRNRVTREAFLIELQGSDFWDDPRSLLRKQIAENYIKWKGYDWKYQCVFEKEIMLSRNESCLFTSYCQMSNQDDRAQWLSNYLSFVQLLKPEPFNHLGYSFVNTRQTDPLAPEQCDPLRTPFQKLMVGA